MYRTPLKAMVVQALKRTLAADGDYPQDEQVTMRGMGVSIEYPALPANYPGIWVDYDDTEALVKAGVDHEEEEENADHEPVLITRWRFTGIISLTITTLSSLERDKIYDEVVAMIAFARQDPIRGQFVAMIESNDYIACNIDTDTIQPRGSVAAPGTPWGTDEVVYEATVNLNVIGEFIPTFDEATGLLVLSEIIVKAVDTYDEDAMEELEASEAGFGPTQWH